MTTTLTRRAALAAALPALMVPAAAERIAYGRIDWSHPATKSPRPAWKSGRGPPFIHRGPCDGRI
jgi:hypothetical protein